MTVARIELPPKLIATFDGDADVRGAWGGRGSGKTRTFAKMSAVRGFMFGNAGISGQILCGRQFQNSLADSSLEEIKRAIQDEPWLMDYYEIGETFVRSRDGRIEYSFAGLERNIDSIKSKGRILLCWVDEAEGVSDTAWATLIPTLREEGDGWHAELWVTWNPKRKGSATDQRFRRTPDPRIKVAELNWRDNPRFPAVLERQRQRDLAERPDTYNWIWEGAYATVVAGAYFAKHLTAARAAGKVGRVAADPLLTLRAFTDIGGTGRRADSFVWWIGQFVGREVRVLDHYEAVGQPLEAHLAWARTRGYTPDRMEVWLPHDGVTHDRVFDVTYESALTRAGYGVTVVPNQGSGAAIARIEAMRRLFPSIWWDAERCEAGLEALGFYHEKRDEARDVGLGPEHDWSSHSADAAGLMAIVAEEHMRGGSGSPAGALLKRRRSGMAV
jgi:phage terminase large subunit